MKILKTPWKNELMDLVSNSKNNIKITSPFVKENVCNELLSYKKTQTEIELITSVNLLNIYSGFLDLKGLENIINNRGKVKSFPNLHSKIYIFDDKKAIITSSNLTNGGLINNFEYGLFIEDKKIITEVSNDYNILTTDKRTKNVTTDEIDKVRALLSKFPPFEINPSVKQELESYDNFNATENQDTKIDVSLSGWKLEVWKCIQLINSDTFTLSDLNRFENRLKIIYPENNHIPDKIRQQLQYLRNMGFIDFLGNGQYKKINDHKISY